MHDVGWQFPALLITAMILAMVMTLFQVRRYNRELQESARAASGPDNALISGRCRSFRGGAVVVMVVDTARGEVVRATAMTGRTVFARFRERSELIGPVAGLADRARSRALRRGTEDALLRLPKPRRGTARAVSASAADRARACAPRRPAPTPVRGATPVAHAMNH